MPTLKEVFELDSYSKFKKLVLDLASKNNGKIPLTHAATNWTSIKSTGYLKKSSGTSETNDGVFCTFGHLTSSSWHNAGEDHREQVLIHIDIPAQNIDKLDVDMNFDPHLADEEGFDEWDYFLYGGCEVGPLQDSKLEGSDIVYSDKIPLHFFKRVIDVKTGKVIFGEKA